MEVNDTVSWLMAGDPSIAWQAARDLTNTPQPNLRPRIAHEGWGKRLLDSRNRNGSWGRGFYVPRWACTHYVLLELKNMGFLDEHAELIPELTRILDTQIADDGGLGHAPTQKLSDTCINGMFLNYASYFSAPEGKLANVIDFLLSVQLLDGGFNCQINRRKVSHSSLHTTISVLEGFHSYQAAGYTYRLAETQQMAKDARSFITQHRFFKSDRTGHIIHPDFLSLPYPPRWRYNILRALDHFREAGVPPSPAMADAIDALMALKRKDGRWPRMKKLAGEVFFTMEPPRGPSRWNTLLALRVLKTYAPESNAA